MKTFRTSHTVVYGDLNPHATLYAGRAMEWAFEANFMATVHARREILGIVYKNTHKFDFFKPVRVGAVLEYAVTLVRAGEKTLTMRTGIYDSLTEELVAEAYMTFVTIDEETGKSVPNGITLDPAKTEEEKAWRAEAESYFYD